MEDQLKLQEAFRLSLLIPGSTFYHMSELGITRVYKIVDCDTHEFEYESLYINELDGLIESLKNHINDQQS